jgi:3-isopropylmalate/(R)-2-methylmalate dehydratase small subunit
MTGRIRGRAWVFGDQVNTDDMFPGFAMKLPVAEAARHMFDATRPGWSELVEPGDVVVAGRGFGLGSSRPVAELFVHLGVSCLLAEQYNSLFLRNALNYGLPAITLPNARSWISEGDLVEVDLDASTVRNATRDEARDVDPFPDFILRTLSAGGLVAQLEDAGHLRPPTTS